VRKTLPVLDTEILRSKLKVKHLSSQATLLAHHPHVKRLLASGAIAGSLLLSPGQSALTQASLPAASSLALVSTYDYHNSIKDQLAAILPSTVDNLNENQETKISTLLHQVYGIHASAELEGNRLNRSYGLMGLEQHLPRYPGDNRPNTTPGRGAWGYWTYSANTLTEEMIQQEKYYVAVQTLYLPDWNTRLAYLRDWYKYRKVVLVNPKNGKVIVAVVADSGPGASTGKHFGGSPEVMEYLHMFDGKQRSGVVLFFVDDPDDKIPLGPLEQNLERGPALLTGV
jgi:hypothetical protein